MLLTAFLLKNRVTVGVYGGIMRLSFYVAIISCLVCLGCANRVSTKSFNELHEQVDQQKKQLDELKSKVDDVRLKQSLREWTELDEKVAYLTPGSSGYSPLRLDVGTVTVDLASVREYANGSRVTLRFGNVTNATLTGVKAAVEWGTVDEKGSPKNEEAKSKEINFEKSLRPGAWTSVDIVLEEIPPSKLGFVRLHDVSNKSMSLYKNPL
jgi:hypothetical protein